MHVCFCGRLYYGDLGKVPKKGINCRIPRTSQRRGADNKKQAREHRCFGSLTGFLSAVFFYFFSLYVLKGRKKTLTKGLRTLLYGCMDLQKGLILIKLFGIDTHFNRANIKKKVPLLLLDINTFDVKATALIAKGGKLYISVQGPVIIT